MSSGFTGSSTRGLSELDKEIEYRLGRIKMDVFTEDFSPPGTADVTPDQNIRNPGPYAKKHDDLAAAGKASDQKASDVLDIEAYRQGARVKQQRDQFPGAKMSKPGDGPEAFDKEVEKRMTHMASKKVRTVKAGGSTYDVYEKSDGSYYITCDGLNIGAIGDPGSMADRFIHKHANS